MRLGPEAEGRKLRYKDRQKKLEVKWCHAWDNTSPDDQFRCFLRGQALNVAVEVPAAPAPAGECAQNSFGPSDYLENNFTIQVICIRHLVVWSFDVWTSIGVLAFGILAFGD